MLVAACVCQGREKERFRAAVMAWRNGGETAGDAAAETAGDAAAKSAAETSSGHEGGGKLLEGEYDEVCGVMVWSSLLARAQ